jgi:hypothetical protein
VDDGGAGHVGAWIGWPGFGGTSSDCAPARSRDVRADPPRPRAVVAEIELRMRAVGLRGGAPDGTYRQSISGSGGCNVLGRLEGTGASDRAILVSAHHDHLGLDAGGTPFPGADDNARQYQKAKWTLTDCRAGLPPWASCARTP